MAKDEDYEVGYGRPPRKTQFKKGQPSANPHGRRKTGPIDVAAFFAEPVTVPVNGRRTKMDVFEVTLGNLAKKAINGDLRAAQVFVDFCDEAGMLGIGRGGNAWPMFLTIPKDYDHQEWHANLERLGPPPWPGEHNGLPRLTSDRQRTS